MAQSLRHGIVMSALALLVGVAVPACSSTSVDHSGPSASDESVGSLGLKLVTPGGVTVSTVHYTISGNGITPITGDIDVSASGATASVLVGAIPAGNGYSVTMSADGSGGNSCSGSTTFNVAAGTTVGVTVPLTCGAPTARGNGIINGTFNSCPVITSLIVSPLQLDVGGKINVSAAASDPDTGATLTYAWTSVGTGGSFVNAATATTQFNASAPGTQTLTVSVSDGKGCVTTLSGDVNVTTSAVCGNQIVETGEQCELPVGNTTGTATCTAACQNRVATCGDAFVQTGEQCDPPNGTTCSATCKTIVCGDSKTEGAEQCDPPVAGVCDATCKNITKVCGDGFVQAGEDCDPPNTATCDATCHTIDQCNTCTATECVNPLAACNSAPNAAGCSAILACVKSSNCADGSLNDGKECYCGAVDSDTCFNTADATIPQGACKGVIETAAATTNPSLIGQAFFKLASPVGAAFQTVSCQLGACQTQCGF